MGWMVPEGSKRTALLVLLALLCAAFALYAPSFDNAWLMDDYPVIVDNPDILSVGNFFDNQYPGRPLREITYLLDFRLFGLEPAGWHIQQNIWHGLNCWLIFLLALRLGTGMPAALGAALLFLVHPVNVEVVANISHRKDSLALAFCLMSVLAWLRGRQDGRWNWPWLVAASALWGLGLLAKENALVLPLVVLTWELLRMPPRTRIRLGRGLAFGLAVGVTARILYLVQDVGFQQQVGRALLKMGTFQGWTPSGYFQTVIKSWAFMVGKLLWPVNLSMEYAFAVPAGWFDFSVLAGLASVLALLGAVWWSTRQAHFSSLPLVWVLSFWLPTSNLLGHHAYLAADRYWYAPLAGVCILSAYGLWRLVRQRVAVLVVATLPLFVLLSWQSWAQQQVWRDAESFHRQILKVNPNSLEGLLGMSVVIEGQGDLEGARAWLAKAQRVSPLDGRVSHRLGRLAMAQGRRQEAAAHFLRAIELDPALTESYNDLGLLYDQMGEPGEAVKYLQKALELNPHFGPAHTNLGVVYEGLGRLEEALAMHRRAISERPDYGEAYYNLGVASYRSGRLAEALTAFEQASRLLPEDGDALFNLSVIALETGDRARAESNLLRLAQLDAERAKALRALLATGQTTTPQKAR